MKRVLKKTISMFLTVFIVLLVALNIIGLATKKNNYGAPKFFNLTVLNVATDSMEPTLRVGTLVFVKSVTAEELVAQEKDADGNITVEGDIITFYRNSDERIITHRLLKKTLNSDKTYTLECFGDNMTSSQCVNNDCSDYPHDFINSKYLIGKVVYASYGLGCIYTFMSNRFVSFILIIVPGLYVMITALADFIAQVKEVKLEKEANEKTLLENGGLTREQELEKLKEELKKQYRKDVVNKEKKKEEKED